MSFEIPILFLVFNRPENTQRVFEEIKKQKPKFLFVAADGARPHIEDDILKCKNSRKTVLNAIDWDCELKTLFRDENLGCGKAVQSALDWFFDEVEMGVIIEDDIIPHPSFFSYAESLLHKFKDNDNIFSINGCNLAYENFENDYGLTRYFNMWGWATWRRSNDLVRKSWSTYNEKIDFKKGSELLKGLSLNTIWPQDEWIYNWQRIFKATNQATLDTWDYQWVYTCLKAQIFCIRPNLNLVNNIGFNDNSTHTIRPPHVKLRNMRVHEMNSKGKGLKGKMEIDPKYEIRNVAGYWHAIGFDFNDLINKIFKKINKKTKHFFDRI